MLTHHELVIPDLDPAHDGLVLAHMSDVHVGMITPRKRIERAIALVNSVEADIVMLTGDYVCYAKRFVPIMGELLGGIRARSGVVATLGNHDYWTDGEGVARALAGSGFDVLRNASVELRPRGAPLTVVGIDDAVTKHDDAARAFQGVRKGGTILTLTHCPELADTAADRGAQLVVAGHTHGGHVFLPGVTESVFKRVTRRRYVSGWYDVADARLYVNRGVGSSSVPVRAGAGAKSEVAAFTLRRAA